MTQFLLGRLDLQSGKLDGLVVTSDEDPLIHIAELDEDDLYANFLIPSTQAQVDLLRKLANALQTIVGAQYICTSCGTRQGVDTLYCQCGQKLKE